MKVISFINMKGGVAKTTSTVEIAAILAKEHGKEVLIIDLDPQTNATLSLITLEAWEQIKDDATIADVLGMNRGMSSRSDDFDINKAVIHNVCGIEHLDLIPSHLDLTFLDLDLVSRPARENILQSQIGKLAKQYDYILIDCPPNLTLAPQNALVVSDYIIVPVVPEIFPAIGLPLLVNRVQNWKKSMTSSHVEFLGMIFTKVDARATTIHGAQMDALRRKNIIDVFSTIIPQNIDLSKAVANSRPALLVYPNCSGVQSYKTLVREILNKIES